MSQTTTIPFFAAAPAEYSQEYIAQVTRAFALYAQQQQNPGPIRANTLNLTGLSAYANNTAAVSGGLAVNDVYKTATGELRIGVTGGGGGGTKLLDPVFTYTAGLLTSILYEGGHTKTMTYNVDNTLSQLVSVIDSITTTKTFTWNVDGTLAYITQT